MEVTLPKVSIVIPTYNEEKNIRTCLNAILRQNYPKDLIEIIIVDNRSTDKTINIIKEYMENNKNMRLLFNDIAKDAEISKMIGLRNAKGELFMYLDADIEVVGKDWLIKLVKPLIDDSSLVGSFPRFIPKPDDVPIGRYLRYHPLELDPVLQFFCTEISETIIEDRGSYKVCKFNPPKVPPIGICLYRKNILIRTIGDKDKFMDIDVPVILSKKGYNKFAYVPSCGIYHVNVKSLGDLIRKRLRNIDKVYLPNIENREFKYFDLKNKRDFLKIIIWIIYSNIFIPKLIKGIYMSVRNKDIACIYEPIVTMILTNAIIFGFLKNEKGRKMIKNILSNLFKAIHL